jgi:hypothetical protein
MSISCINDQPEFFAEVLRSPAVRREDGGRRLRIRFFDARRFFSEFAIIAFLGFGFALWFSQLAGRWAYLVFAVLVAGYSVAALIMKRMDERTRVEINGRRLSLGSDKDKVECVGTIEEILCVDLSGHEDTNRSESGSSRVYVVMKNNDDSFVIPLLISSTDLRPTAKRLASLLECRYRDGRGLASVPQEVRSWKWETGTSK